MEPTSNTLGLDFDQLKISSEASPRDAPAAETAAAAESAIDDGARDKKKPYVNPERVRTGGAQRDKLSDEALSERMARMKEQNDKIKQRRLDVMADEDKFKKTQESERIKQAHNRKVQANVDLTREQNAKRKMAKIQQREWDAQKGAAPNNTAADTTEGSSLRGERGGARGRGSARGRGGVRSSTSDAPPQTTLASPTEAATPV